MAAKNFYDAVLLGLGLPTLLAGGLLAKRGFRVLVVGQGQPLPSYEVDGFTLPRAPFTLYAARLARGHARVLGAGAQAADATSHCARSRPRSRPILPQHRIDFVGSARAASRAKWSASFPPCAARPTTSCSAAQRSWERLNRLVERDLIWPPRRLLRAA